MVHLRINLSRFGPLVGTGLSAMLQMAAFVFVARTIGASGYADIVIVAVIAAVSSELVGFGCGDKVIKACAKDESNLQAEFEGAISLILVTLPIACAIACLVLYILIPGAVPTPIYVLLISEIVSLRALAFLEHVCIATNQFKKSVLSKIVFASMRFIVAGSAYYYFQDLTSAEWAKIQAPLTFIVSIALLTYWSRKNLSKLSLSFPRFDQSGLHFTFTQLIRAAQSVVDRAVATAVLSKGDLGLYGAVSRFISVAYIPGSVFLRQRYRGLFESSTAIGKLRQHVISTCQGSIYIGVATAALLLILSELLPTLLGRDFSNGGALMRILSPVPAAVALNNALLDFITAVDRQKLRSIIQICGSCVIVGVAIAGVRSFGVEGLALGVLFGNIANLVTSGSTSFMVYRNLTKVRSQ